MIRYLFPFFIWLLIVPACRKSDPESLEELFYLRRAGADMPVYVFGNSLSKTFLVVLHGGPGSSGLTYRLGTYSDLLEEEMAVVYWDQRGQGMAQGNYDSDVVTISTLVEDLEALMLLLRERYGSDIRLFLMGHSWGGALGTAFLVEGTNQLLCDGWIEVSGAHDFPLLVDEQIPLMDSLASEQIGLDQDKAFWLPVREKIEEIMEGLPDQEDVLFLNRKANEAESFLVSRGYVNPTNSYDQDRITQNGLFIDNPLTTATSGGHTSFLLNDELLALSLREELQQINLPTLLLWGAYDLVVPKAVGEQALEGISSADKELIIFPHSGHSPMLAEPEAFSDAIIHFIGEH